MATAMGVDRILSTDDVPVADREAYWRDVICDVFVQLDCRSVRRGPFYGRVTNRTAGACQFTEVLSSAQAVERGRKQLAGATEDYFLVSLQTRGMGRISQDGRTATLQPGDLAVYDTTRPYRLEFERDLGEIVLRLPRQALSERIVAPERLTARTIRGSVGIARVASAHIVQTFESLSLVQPEFHDRLTNTVVDLVAAAASEQLIGRQEAASSSSLATLQRTLNHIEVHLSDPDLSRASVAAAIGISPRYLNQLFQIHDCGFGEWVLRRRLQRCWDDLHDPALRALGITEVAFRWGFNDASHFSRSFRNQYGVSPRASRAG